METIYFDLDGTLANLYAVDNWLDMLIAQDPTPYIIAKPMLNMSSFARLMHKAQRLNYKIGIVSWLSKSATDDYNIQVTMAKLKWLKTHLPSVKWDEIKIIAYGTPKSKAVNDFGFLFDDEEQNRIEWGEGAYEPNEILEFLRGLK